MTKEEEGFTKVYPKVFRCCTCFKFLFSYLKIGDDVNNNVYLMLAGLGLRRYNKASSVNPKTKS